MGDGPAYDYAYGQAKKLSEERHQMADDLIRQIELLIFRTRHHSSFARVHEHLDDAYAHLIRVREGL